MTKKPTIVFATVPTFLGSGQHVFDRGQEVHSATGGVPGFRYYGAGWGMEAMGDKNIEEENKADVSDQTR